MSRESSFTLIELLIVLGILAVIATVAILALNPQELIKQARDTQRMADLATLNKALAVYQSSGQMSLGSATTVYVSVPANQTNCSDLGLPTLPSGYTYACVTSSTLRSVNGTGWIPLAFSSVSYGAPLEKLPVDPINTTTTRNYYIYIPGGSWELATAMESAKFKMGGSADQVSKDGGPYPELYEEGTNLALLPIDYGDSSLVGYWKFDEGSGGATSDSSGSNAIMSIGGSAPWISGKIGNALSFDGTSGMNTLAADNATLDSAYSSAKITFTAWIYYRNTGGDIMGFSGYLPHWGYSFQISGGYTLLKFQNAAAAWQVVSSNLAVPINQWSFVAVTYEPAQSQMIFYVNNQSQTVSYSTAADYVGGPFKFGTVGWNAINGNIDDARVYNRILSAKEIMAIYNAVK